MPDDQIILRPEEQGEGAILALTLEDSTPYRSWFFHG